MIEAAPRYGRTVAFNATFEGARVQGGLQWVFRRLSGFFVDEGCWSLQAAIIAVNIFVRRGWRLRPRSTSTMRSHRLWRCMN